MQPQLKAADDHWSSQAEESSVLETHARRHHRFSKPRQLHCCFAFQNHTFTRRYILSNYDHPFI